MSKLIIAVFVVAIVAISCNKELSATNDLTVKPVADSSKYMSFTPNSSWTYLQIDNVNKDTVSYTVTSTNRDSLLGAKTYHIFSSIDSQQIANTTGGFILYNITGRDYYSFVNLTAALGGDPIETVYLNDSLPVNGSWLQSYTVNLSGLPLTVNLTNFIAEKNTSKTVNGILYTDVIHVITKISATALGVAVPDAAIITNIEGYYAKKYGLIQSVNKVSFNFGGAEEATDLVTTLQQATIK